VKKKLLMKCTKNVEKVGPRVASLTQMKFEEVYAREIRLRRVRMAKVSSAPLEGRADETDL
jgi:hypothetical protein